MASLLLAEFADSGHFVETAKRASNADFRLIDAYTPFPVEGVQDLLAHRHSRIRVAMFVGGIAMAALAYGLEYFSAVVNYPYNSGGRPLDAWPAFMLVPFATGILVVAITGFSAFLIECGLPRLHHPLFAVEGFERATQDRFVLAIERPTGNDGLRRALNFFRAGGATAIARSKYEARPRSHGVFHCYQPFTHGLRFEHDATAQTLDLRAKLVVAGRLLGAAAASASGCAGRRRTRCGGKSRSPRDCRIVVARSGTFRHFLRAVSRPRRRW